MGLFDWVFSFFSLVDSIFGVMLPQIIRLIIWGVIASVISMSVYVLLSSQKKLVSIKDEISKARKLLIDYDDKFSEIWIPVKKLIGLSFRQLGYTLLPSMAGAIPVLLLVIWIGPEFNYGNLNPDELTLVDIYPKQAFITLDAHGEKKIIQGSGSFLWPGPGEILELLDGNNRLVAVFPLKKTLPGLEKYKWWNFLFGNPNGYIPESALVDKIEIQFPRNRFFPLGPDWMGCAEVMFFLSILITSLIIKVRFKIQ